MGVISDVLGGPLYQWIKAFHILSVIAWMAGLLYLPRLYVYHVGATPGGELDATLVQQERRLLRFIMNPAMIAAWALGLAMIAGRPELLSFGWLHVKLLAIVLMTVAHHVYATARKAFASGANTRSERYWRIVNEAPAILAIVIVVMAVVEPF